MAQIYDKDKIPKENIKTQKVTSTLNLIRQLEPSAPKEILVESKVPNYFSLLSGETG